MKTLYKNHKGFAHVGLLLLFVVVIAAVGGVGYYVFTNKTNSKVNQTTVMPSATVVKDSSTKDFYDCLYDKSHNLSETVPYTCTLGGKTYTYPSAYNNNQIKYFDKLPESVKPLVTSIAKSNFETCIPGTQQVVSIPKTSVELAQSNYVILGIECGYDAGLTQIALQDGTWVNLGHGQFGVGCEDVDKYGIKQSSYTSKDSIVDTCYYKDNSSKQVPK